MWCSLLNEESSCGKHSVVARKITILRHRLSCQKESFFPIPTFPSEIFFWVAPGNFLVLLFCFVTSLQFQFASAYTYWLAAGGPRAWAEYGIRHTLNSVVVEQEFYSRYSKWKICYSTLVYCPWTNRYVVIKAVHIWKHTNLREWSCQIFHSTK